MTGAGMTTSVNAELQELAESIFGDAASGDTGFDAALWRTLEETGLARLTLPAAAGGSEGTLEDSAVVLAAAGAHAARVPLVETDLVGGWLLHAAGVPLPDGPLTAAAGSLEVDGTTVRGQLRRVPWARAAAGVVVLTDAHVVLLDPGAVEVTEGTNVAEEPRDTVSVDGPAAAVAPAPEGAAAELRLRAALGRAQLLAGAARAALSASVRYAGERVQFGRPIAKFQAVQHNLARLAGETAAAVAAAGSAADAIANAQAFDEGVRLEAISAKIRCAEAAQEGAAIAHQVHGAIGFTKEHVLHRFTLRMLAWRDDFGHESHWAVALGHLVAARGADAFWPLIASR